VDGQTTSKAELAQLMVGREVLFRIQKKPAEPNEPVLTIDQLSCLNDRGLPALDRLSLEVRAGEVVGIAGVAGNGQTELAQVITGQRPAVKGSISVQGDNVTNQRALTTIDKGVAYIPADRNGVGSSPNLSLTDNLILKSYRQEPIGAGWRVNHTLATEQAAKLIDQFDVKTPSTETPARLLSGGNLQKLILAREISPQPSLIIAVYPVRGLDVGAIEAIHQMLIDERDRGAGILLISEDLDELLSLSDRLVVMFDGQIMGEVPPQDDQIEQIGLMMAGTKAGKESEA
ncbi:MAG: ATP-binding cassette domain-containing protein, partial [Chloroflexota bacterium]